MAKSAPTPVVIQGNAAGKQGPEPQRTETWGDDGGMPQLAGPVETVEMDGGIGEQNKAETIMQALRGDGEQAEFNGKSATTDVVEVKDPIEAKVEPEKDAPKRKDLFKQIEAEKRARALETELKKTQAQAELLSKGSIGQIMAARGWTREQALEALALGDDAAPVAKVDPVQAKLAELEAYKTQQIEAGVARAVASAIEPMDLPLVKAGKPVPVPQGDGTVKYRAVHSVIAELAEQMWIEEGRQPEDVKPYSDYVPEAAKRLEEALDEEFSWVTKAKAPKSTAKAPVASVGKRSTPAKTQPDAREFNDLDDDARRWAIKQRFGV